MDAALHYYRPTKGIFNLRIIVFAAVVLGLFGYPLYTFVSQSLSGGMIWHGNICEVNLKALGYFHFDPINGTVNDVPAKFRALDGKRVQLEGQVYDPNEASDRITHFQFVYSIQKCCFGGPPQVQERVFVSTPPGHPLNCPGDMGRLTGILHVNITHDSKGNVATVYTMDAQTLEGM